MKTLQIEHTPNGPRVSLAAEIDNAVSKIAALNWQDAKAEATVVIVEVQKRCDDALAYMALNAPDLAADAMGRAAGEAAAAVDQLRRVEDLARTAANLRREIEDEQGAEYEARERPNQWEQH